MSGGSAMLRVEPQEDPGPAAGAAAIGRPRVSVIVPVRNVAATLARTLASLAAQTVTDWEAVVVDDGSDDATPVVIAAHAAADPRIRALRQPAAGVSAARNRGLREARHPFVLFLDGDDTIAPEHLERMTAVLAADPTLDAVHCGWQRILPDGSAGRPHLGPDLPDLFDRFAYQCLFAIHACLVRRDRALAVGGFDMGLRTCEDWDFHQRFCRSGARFGRVPDVLAQYHVRGDSASRDVARCLADARVVLDRGHGPDPRLAEPAPDHVDGRPPGYRDLSLACIVTAFAAGAIGAGAEPTVQPVEPMPGAAELDPGLVADILQEHVPVGAGLPESAWPILWPRVARPLERFLDRLELRTGAPGLAQATLRRLERGLSAATTLPASFGRTHAVAVELAEPVRDVMLPPGTDRLYCRLSLKGQTLAEVCLPGPRVVTAREIVTAALADGRRGRIARKALDPKRRAVLVAAALRHLLHPESLRLIPRTRPSRLLRSALQAALPLALTGRTTPLARGALADRTGRLARIAAAARESARAAAGPPDSAEDGGAGGWAEGWDGLFALPDPWAYGSDYEAVKYAQTLELLPDGEIGSAVELACAEGHFTRMLAPRVGRLLALDIAATALERAEQRCAGMEHVTFGRIDLERDAIPSPGPCPGPGPADLIVCSEVLYYMTGLPGTVARIAEAVKPGGLLLTCHARVLADEPGDSGFAWNQPFGVATIAREFQRQPGLALEWELATPLYRILLFRRLLPGEPAPVPEIRKTERMGRLTPVAAGPARWPGKPVAAEPAGETRRVPILMYHRVTAEGPERLARWRTDPALFAAQIEALHAAGWRTLTLAEAAAALRQRRPLPGRPVVISFDDGYRDVVEQAVPLLRAHGFTATLFAVADRIGGRADWDAAAGPPAPLADWRELRALAAAGFEIGGHSCRHKPLDGMEVAGLTAELVRCRTVLEEGLARRVTSFAYPYGGEDEIVRRLAAEAGFAVAVGCRPGIAGPDDDPLRLPRIEVEGGCAPQTLLQRLGARP